MTYLPIEQKNYSWVSSETLFAQCQGLALALHETKIPHKLGGPVGKKTQFVTIQAVMKT